MKRACLLGALACAAVLGPSGRAAAATVTVDTGTTRQKMAGWEAVAWAFHSPSDPNRKLFTAIKDQLLDAVVEAGVNRVRLEVRSGVENATDYWAEYQKGTIAYDVWRANRYATVNDNGDPTVLGMAGFHFSEMDDTIGEIVEPLRARLAAAGEKLHVNVNYVAFTSQITTGSYHHDAAAEYAEFVLATYTHLRDSFGWVPDSFEIILEPDNVSQWSGTYVGEAMAAAGKLLVGKGFDPPRFIAPSNTNMANAITYFDAMVKVPGATTYLGEFAYHRYGGVSTANLMTIAARGAGYGIGTSMLEWWTAANTHHTLHEDLEIGNNAAWQQGTLAGPTLKPDEAALFSVDTSTPGSPKLVMNTQTKFRRQYYKFVRMGARRVAATSTDGGFKPLAFVNTDGRHVVVVKASAGGSISIAGLPAGTYQAKYTTAAAYDVDSPPVTISAGGALAGSIPAAGVITFWGGAGGGADGGVDSVDGSADGPVDAAGGDTPVADGKDGGGADGGGGGAGGGMGGKGGGGAGGAGGQAPDGGQPGADGGGCGCRMAGGGGFPSLPIASLLLLGLVRSRRR